jgi:hypothetical protein
MFSLRTAQDHQADWPRLDDSAEKEICGGKHTVIDSVVDDDAELISRGAG